MNPQSHECEKETFGNQKVKEDKLECGESNKNA